MCIRDRFSSLQVPLTASHSPPFTARLSLSAADAAVLLGNIIICHIIATTTHKPHAPLSTHFIIHLHRVCSITWSTVTARNRYAHYHGNVQHRAIFCHLKQQFGLIQKTYTPDNTRIRVKVSVIMYGKCSSLWVRHMLVHTAQSAVTCPSLHTVHVYGKSVCKNNNLSAGMWLHRLQKY